MNLEGYKFVLGAIGRDAVYPGHPVTIGLLIMLAFPDLKAAERRSPDLGHTAASESSLIPGAGGSVGDALSLLRYVQKANMTPRGALRLASDIWDRTDSQRERYPDRRLEGQLQANQLQDRYVEKLKTWAIAEGEWGSHLQITSAMTVPQVADAIETMAQTFELGALRSKMDTYASKLRKMASDL